MKYLLATLICLSADAANLRLSWSLPPGTTTVLTTNGTTVFYPDVSGLNLYQGSTLLNFRKIASLPAGATNYTLTNVTAGKFFVYLTATNMWGESSTNSNIFVTPAIPPAVIGTRLSVPVVPGPMPP